MAMNLGEIEFELQLFRLELWKNKCLFKYKYMYSNIIDLRV